MEFLHQWYWWPTIVADTQVFCNTCDVYQQMKGINYCIAGKLHSLPIPVKPWNFIGMDFIGPFLEAKGFNYL